jgi:hypothetical protein
VTEEQVFLHSSPKYLTMVESEVFILNKLANSDKYMLHICDLLGDLPTSYKAFLNLMRRGRIGLDSSGMVLLKKENTHDVD